MNTMKFLTIFFSVAGMSLSHCADTTKQTYKLTKHITERMVERCITPSDVAQILQHGEKNPLGKNVVAATHNVDGKKIKLIYNEATHRLITTYKMKNSVKPSKKSLRKILPKKLIYRLDTTEDKTDITYLKNNRVQKIARDRHFKSIERAKSYLQKTKKQLALQGISC